VGLVRLAQRGDRDAFGELYETHAPMLVGLARRILRDGEAAADAVHDAFVEAWRKVRQFDPERGSVRGWLATIVRSRAIDRHRVRARTRDREIQVSDGREPADPTPSLERLAEGPGVHRLLGELSPDHREAIRLTYFEGFTMAEAAARMEVPVGTVKAWVHRGLAQLRARAGEST